jgi:putative DNA primase/helicase
MTLIETIMSAGMTPPRHFMEGRWLRFPGIGKGGSNRSGWCRVIAPTLAIYGDWSCGLTAIWKDDAHRDDETSAQLLRDAQARERKFAAEQRKRNDEGASLAAQMLKEATPSSHPYLVRKGFPQTLGLVHGENLLVPVRDSYNQRVISVQQISGDGEKRFLAGARARGGVYRLGSFPGSTLLCEGYATGLTLYEAARRLYRRAAVVVCFSAGNIEVVAQLFKNAMVCADHDESGTGEHVAIRTGLAWIKPPLVGTDFNDLHCSEGIHAVIGMLRG